MTYLSSVSVFTSFVRFYISVSKNVFILVCVSKNKQNRLEVCVKCHNAVKWSEGRSQKVRGIGDVIQKGKLF